MKKSELIINELSESDFYKSKSYFSKLGYAYGNIEMINKRYAQYNLVFDKNKKVYQDNSSNKRDLTIIRDIVSNKSYVTANSLSNFLMIYVGDLKKYIQVLKVPLIMNGISVKYVIPLELVDSIITDIKDNWENVQNCHKNSISILKNNDLISFVNSYDKHSMHLRIRKDLVSVATFLGLPVKYHVKNDLVQHINRVLYDEYRYHNCLDALGNLEKDSAKLKEKLSKVQAKIKEVDSPDYLVDKLSSIIKNKTNINPSLVDLDV